MSFKEQQELEKLPVTIQELEAEQEELSTLLADVASYQKNPQQVVKYQTRMEAVMDELLKSYERWEYLESLKSQ